MGDENAMGASYFNSIYFEQVYYPGTDSSE